MDVDLDKFAAESGNRAEIKAKSADIALPNALHFDPCTKELTGPNGPVALRAQSAEVLAVLAAEPGRIVSKEILFAAVWPDTNVTDDSLVKCIADIRQALGDGDRTIVQTLPRLGYRLNRTPKAQARVLHRSGLLIGAALAICGLLTAILLLWLDVPAPPDRPRLAVLAFDDFSTGEEKGFLSDAIAEGLITELARFPTIEVIARSSSFQYRDGSTDIATIRDELRVHYVLEGSQQKLGDALRITAQLIDTRTGTHVWTETYDRELADLLAVQEQIVRAVAGIVADIVELRPMPDGDLNQVSAMRYFLLARERFDSREEVESRFVLGTKAIEIDPDSEWGYLTLGWANRHMAVFYAIPADKEAYLSKAAEYADKAIQIAPDNYVGYFLRARVHSEFGEHAAAIQSFQQAIALNPSASQVLVGSSSPLLYTGHIEEGLRRIDRALDLDPKHTGWFHWQRAWALWELKRCDEALRSFQRMAKIPNVAHRMLAATYSCLGRKDEAAAAMLVFLDDNPGATLAAEAENLQRTWPNPTSVERWLHDMAFAGMPE